MGSYSCPLTHQAYTIARHIEEHDYVVNRPGESGDLLD